MLSPEFTGMMPHTIKRQAFISRNAWGDVPVYGSSLSYAGRVVDQRKKVINSKGEEVISERTIYLATTDNIGMDDLIILPSGYLPQMPEIIMVKRFPDEFGDHHVQVYC
jgi:hypothetical protein